jgi:hypothetical protein
VGPGAGLDAEVRGKILCPCRGSNPAVQSIVRHYTDWSGLHRCPINRCSRMSSASARRAYQRVWIIGDTWPDDTKQRDVRHATKA